MNRVLGAAVSVVFLFAAFARGARDLWAATFVVVAVLALVNVLLWKSTRSPSKDIQFPQAPGVLLVALALLINLFLSSNRAETFVSLFDWLTAILLFVVALNIFQTRERVDFLLASLVPLFWIELGVVVWQIFNLDEREKMGTLVNANLFVAFILPWSILFLHRTLQSWQAGERTRALFWVSGLGAALGCLAAAQSDAGWLCIIIGGTALVGLPRTRPWPQWVRKSLSLIIFCVSVLVLGLLYLKFTRVYDPNIYPHRDANNRFYWWISALHMFREHPWAGIGLGNFQNAYLSFKVGGTENTLFPHSYPLGLLAETGIVGTAAVLYFLFGVVRTVRHSPRLNFERAPFAVALASVGLFTSFNIGLEYLINMMTVAVFLGILVAAESHTYVRIRPSVAILTAGLTLIALPYLASPFLASRFIVSGRKNFEVGKKTAAEKDFQNAIQIWSLDWEPFAGLAQLAAQKGDVIQAAGFQTEALKRNFYSLPLRRTLETFQTTR